MTNAPKIELKAIKHNASLSEETHCYSATLYVDGVKWGQVSNRGHGGSDDFHGVNGRAYADIAALDKRIAATLPAIEAYGMTLAPSLEGICCDLVNEWLAKCALRRMLGSKVLFTRADAQGLYSAKPPKGMPIAQAAEQIAARHPGARILNLLPEAEALAIFRAAA